MDVGLTTRGQVMFLRNEANRLLDKREHQRETIVGRAIEVCILGALITVLNFVMQFLEYGLEADLAAALALFAIVLFVGIVGIVCLAWNVVDRMRPMPLLKLRLFAEDISGLVVLMPDTSPPRPRLAASSHRARWRQGA